MMPDTIKIPDHLRSRIEHAAADRDQNPERFTTSILGVAIDLLEQQDGDELRAMMDRSPFHVPLETDPSANAAKSALVMLDALGDMARDAVGRFLDGDGTNHPRIKPSMILPLLDAVGDVDLMRRDGDKAGEAECTKRLLDIWNGTD